MGRLAYKPKQIPSKIGLQYEMRPDAGVMFVTQWIRQTH